MSECIELPANHQTVGNGTDIIMAIFDVRKVKAHLLEVRHPPKIKTVASALLPLIHPVMNESISLHAVDPKEQETQLTVP